MKKVIIITNHSYMLYRFRLELIRELMKEHEVVLVMPFVGHEDDFRAMGLRCIRVDMNRRGFNPLEDGKLLSDYWKLLKRERPDLVITYSIKPNIYAGLVCSLLKIPYCANVQGLGTAFQKKYLAEFVTLLYKLALKKAQMVFFENESNAQEFRRRKILTEKKQTVLPGAGINLEKYQAAPYPENDRVRFLYMGRIMREKGLDELLDAIEQLREEKGDRVVLDLVGFFEEEYRERVEKLARQGCVVFHGFQKEPQPYYAKADCVVLPSHHEGMSNVLLEAAASARPVITTDIPGCRETVDSGVSGYLCRVKDTQSLLEQMRRMAELPREAREAMGKAGAEKMHREFDKKKVVARTIRVLGGKEAGACN